MFRMVDGEARGAPQGRHRAHRNRRERVDRTPRVRLLRCEGCGGGVDGRPRDRVDAGRARRGRCVPPGSLGVHPGRRRPGRGARRDAPAGGGVARRPGPDRRGRARGVAAHAARGDDRGSARRAEVPARAPRPVVRARRADPARVPSRPPSARREATWWRRVSCSTCTRDRRSPTGKKSLAFSVDFRDPARTLEREEADEAVARIRARVAEELGGELREGGGEARERPPV